LKSKAALSGIGVRFRGLLHGDRKFIANMVAESSTVSSVARLSMKIKAPLKGRQGRLGVINV
jgi:hypothetical protein